MFSIHSTELLLVAIVALLVIGPEKLPNAVRTASLWIGRFRRSFHKMKSEIERELNADEIRRQLHNESVLADIEQAKKRIQKTAQEAESSVKNLVSSDELDPGAAKQSYLSDNESQIEEAKEELIQSAEYKYEEKPRYGGGKNPKLGDQAEEDSNEDKVN